MSIFRILSTACLLSLISAGIHAQTAISMVVEEGGTGEYKAEIVGDKSLENFAIYRPTDLKACKERQGLIPVILYGNGACMNSSVEARYFLNEIASHGYICVAIGPYSESDFIEHWRGVMKTMAPSQKQVVLADGSTVTPQTAEEKLAEAAAQQAQQANQKKSTKKSQTTEVPVERRPTNARQLLEALDWLTDQNANPESEYYHLLDLEHVAAMGQSCGGAQALGVCHDLRIKTGIILNSGIGDMQMQGVSKAQLENLHSPMIYFVGGEEDIAYPNGTKDFERISKVPVILVNTVVDGHEGSYYEAHGGKYAQAVVKYLDWQFKSKVANAAYFLNEKVLNTEFPGWKVQSKNY